MKRRAFIGLCAGALAHSAARANTRTRLRPSIHQDFARSPGESEYPELWRGLVGAWVPGIQKNGSKLFDLSGNETHGTLTNGPTWAPGKYGRALSFTSSTEHVVTGTTAERLNNLPSTGSGAFWLHARFYTTVTSNAGDIVRKHNTNSGGWQFIIAVNNRIDFNIWGFSTNYRSLGNNSDISANTWHHIVLAWDGNVNNAAKRYLNGVEVASGTLNAGSGAYSSDASNPIYISNSTSEDFNGLIDDVRIYAGNFSKSMLNTLVHVPYAPFIKRRQIFGFVSAAPPVGRRRGVDIY